MHLIKIDEVVKPKREGDLGISRLRKRNDALLSKWGGAQGRIKS